MCLSYKIVGTQKQGSCLHWAGSNQENRIQEQ